MLKLRNNDSKINADLKYDCFNALSDGFVVIKLLYTKKELPYDYSVLHVKGKNQTDNLDFIRKESLQNRQEFDEILISFHVSIRDKISSSLNYYDAINETYYEIKTLPLKENNQLVVLYNNVTNYQKTFRLNKRLKKITKLLSVIDDIIKNEDHINQLLNRACETIVDLTDSKLAWITSTNKNNTSPSSFYCSDKYVLSKYKEHVPVFSCIKYAIDNKIPKVYYNPVHECPDCSLHKDYKIQAHAVFPMILKKEVYGVLCIAFEKGDELEQEEKDLYYTLSKDLASAIYHMDTNQNLKMAQEKLGIYSSKIEKQNMELQKLNSELKLNREMLLKSGNKVNESEKLKSTFLANISHEIRTPLNGILGFAQLIKSAKHSYEKIHEYIDIISYSSNLLMGTIDNILDISKLESGELDLHITKVNIKDILDDVVEFNQLNSHKKENVKLKLKLNDLSKGFDVYTDEIKLKQTINVLIHNAYKFTNEGYIEVGLTEKDENIVFYVKDTGIGIEKDMFNIIFQNFRQIDESSTREYGGIGLGLSIAKGLVHLLNGEIWLDSTIRTKEDSSSGTTFYFSIPYKTTNQDNKKTEEIMDIDKIEKIDWSSRKILIVEDDDFSREYLTEALEYTNIELFYAKTGNEAIEKARNVPDLDVILMDIQLPGISGDKATQAIREFNTEIPIIAQTAHAMVNDKESYLNAGCTDYIAKPIAVNDLFSILCKYI